MINAKQEFINHTNGKEILCSLITVSSDVASDKNIKVTIIANFRDGEDVYGLTLTTGYNNEEFELFLKTLNFMYSNGYGSQNLFGVIWYTDGTWSDRSEYDGSENWTYNRCPNIPKILDRTDKVRDIKLEKILKDI